MTLMSLSWRIFLKVISWLEVRLMFRRSLIVLRRIRIFFLIPDRIICPNKSDLGVITKGLLERIIPIIIHKVKLSLWLYSGDVSLWFNNISNKHKYNFLQFDISNYSSSISAILLNKALIFAR